MKILVYSDLHLEFASFDPPEVEADVVVLAGDISLKDFGVFWALEKWPEKPIVYVMGNHEAYKTERNAVLKQLRASAHEVDVYFLENDEVIIDGVRFLGCTLWTDFELFGIEKKYDCIREARENLNDFRLIKEGQNTFTPGDSITLFRRSTDWLKSKLAEPFNGKTVVVTHHLPSKRSVPPEYEEDMLSACFASNLDRLLGKSELWIHGHTHDSFDYIAEGTRIVCNPRGYVQRNIQENSEFNPKLVVTLD